MEYTILKLARLAGISTRTLRYYDEIDLLKPARINSSGYRIYSKKEVNQLQQILFYKELGVELDEIKQIINNPQFDDMQALQDHYQKLLEKRRQINVMIETVQLTIQSRKGEAIMTDQQKFEGLKNKLLEENEQKYGKELREKYGEDVIKHSHEQFKNLTKEQYEAMNQLSYEILELIDVAMVSNDPSSEEAQTLAKKHHEWLGYTWAFYSKEAHAGLAQMYLADSRFTAYYDEKVKPGAAQFLCDAILIYTANDK